MASKIVLTGVPPYDGEYEFEGDFTMRELHTIKQVSGLRAGELADALLTTDTDLVVAISVIVLKRHGVDADENVLWDSGAGSIRIVLGDDTDDEAGDADDPPEVPLEQSGSGGGSSKPGSVTPANAPSPTGGQRSDTSATSAPVTLAS